MGACSGLALDQTQYAREINGFVADNGAKFVNVAADDANAGMADLVYNDLVKYDFVRSRRVTLEQRTLYREFIPDYDVIILDPNSGETSRVLAELPQTKIMTSLVCFSRALSEEEMSELQSILDSINDYYYFFVCMPNQDVSGGVSWYKAIDCGRDAVILHT